MTQPSTSHVRPRRRAAAADPAPKRDHLIFTGEPGEGVAMAYDVVVAGKRAGRVVPAPGGQRKAFGFGGKATWVELGTFSGVEGESASLRAQQSIVAFAKR